MRETQYHKLLSDAARRACDYLENLEQRGVAPAPTAVENLQHLLNEPLPATQTSADEVLAFLDNVASPATMASAGGRYFGFVTGGALPVTVAANWLATAWDQNSFSFASSPAIALFEQTTLDWLQQLFGLPEQTAGALVTGATMANLTALAAARHHVLSQVGWDVEKQGLFGAPPINVIVGDEVHASLVKVLALLGFGRERLIRVPTDRQGRMCAAALPVLSDNTAAPAIICLQAGNVNSGAFDPADKIIPWAREINAWVHVDGAFGLWALASPELESLCAAYRQADSWATDAHKWLNVPYDCGVAMVRNANALHSAMSISGAYLLASAQRDAMDYTPESSRRARSIEVWAALKTLGREGIAAMIERNCRQAQHLASGLSDAGIEVMNEVCLNQIVVHFGDAERNQAIIDAIQKSGECWCGGTTWRGKPAMRISVSSWATSDEDIERSLAAIIQAARKS